MLTITSSDVLTTGHFSARRSKNAGSSNAVSLHAVHPVDRLEVDRDRQQLSVDRRLDAVLVLPPLGEPREVLEDVAAVRVKDVRAVLVDEHARVVVVIVGIAADVVPLVDDENCLSRIFRQPFGHDASRESGSHDEIVKHQFLPTLLEVRLDNGSWRPLSGIGNGNHRRGGAPCECR